MSVPEGVTLATMQPMNGSSQRMAAINNQNDRINFQQRLTALSGGRKKKYKGGFVYPQNRPMYVEVGGEGQTSTSISNRLATVQAQNNANGVFDSQASQQGGRRRRKTRRHSSRRRGRGRTRGRTLRRQSTRTRGRK